MLFLWLEKELKVSQETISLQLIHILFVSLKVAHAPTWQSTSFARRRETTGFTTSGETVNAEVAERSNAHAWKACLRKGARVQISASASPFRR